MIEVFFYEAISKNYSSTPKLIKKQAGCDSKKAAISMWI